MNYRLKKIKTPRITIAYYVGGKQDSNTCLLLLNGYAGPGANSWINQYRDSYLKENYKILNMDYPGSGNSEIHTKDTLHIEDILACISTILENENCTECHIVGLSFGCMVALKYAAYQKEKVNSLTLFSPSYGVSIGYKRALYFSLQMIKRGVPLQEIFTMLNPWAYTEEEFLKVMDIENDLNNTFIHYNTNESLIYLIEIMMNNTIEGDIPSIDVPVKLVAARQDKIALVEKQIELNKKLPNSTLTILEEGGHVIGLSDSTLLNRIIHSHLSEGKANQKG